MEREAFTKTQLYFCSTLDQLTKHFVVLKRDRQVSFKKKVLDFEKDKWDPMILCFSVFFQKTKKNLRSCLVHYFEA